MDAKVAVATVSGKAYFLLVNRLKQKNIQFISLCPGEILPAETRVVITTEREKPLIVNEKILVYDPETEPDALIDEAARILQGKENYDKIVLGIDPGKVFGLALITDGKISETLNCFSSREVLSKIKSIVKKLNLKSTAVTIKIGNGVPAYKNLIEILDRELPQQVFLEVVSEEGTNHPLISHRRGLRDITSAIRIAGRVGHIYNRQGTNEQDH